METLAIAVCAFFVLVLAEALTFFVIRRDFSGNDGCAQPSPSAGC